MKCGRCGMLKEMKMHDRSNEMFFTHDYIPSGIHEVPSNWQIDFENQNSNFRSKLFDLIRKADRENMEKLRVVYPIEVAVYETWMRDPNAVFPKEVQVKVAME